MRSYYKRSKKATDRVIFVAIGLIVMSIAIVGRLFYLQVIEHKFFKALAENQQVMTAIDPATRGKVYLKSNQSGEYATLATNIPLDLLYIDPNPYNKEELDMLIDTAYVAKKIAPILMEHFCVTRVYQAGDDLTCGERVQEFTKLPAFKTETLAGKTSTREVEVEKSDEELVADIEQVLRERISEKEVSFVPLLYTKDIELLQKVKDEFTLPGIYVGEGIVYGNPLEISRDAKMHILETYKPLAEVVDIDFSTFDSMLARRISRYVKLVQRLHPDLSNKVQALADREVLCPQFYTRPDAKEGLLDINDEMCMHLKSTATGKIVRNFFGVVLQKENWRYYPEEELASQVVGYLNFDKEGRYGLEEEFHSLLRGSDGEMKLESDPMGRLIASNLKAEQIQIKEDGVDLYLTLDRVVQKKVEQLVEQKVKDTKANTGQAIVMDPFTGEIIAMGQYPTYNPNNYSDVYEMKRTVVDPGRGIPMYIKDEKGEMKMIYEEDRGAIPSSIDKFVYKNKVGPGAYYNHIVQGTYEPGSIFKPLVVAAGIDSGEITPQTKYHDTGELKVDEFTIRNVSDKCLGYQNMINVLNWSCNIGMSFIARKLGKALLYKYLQDFGIGSRTDIELPEEAKGKMIPFQEWSDARLFNASFGQGLTVTLLQMAQAYSVLANGGVLVAPRIIQKITYADGQEEVTKPQVVKRVISKETADTITAMLTSVAEKGGSKVARIEGFFIAGKTGTAQIAARTGGYEEGVGTTIGSFAGYFPADKPRFVIITKIERPRSTKWADQSAAPLFREIGEFLVEYYHVEPER